jgi:mono/diheme cytochrome c family protein
MTHTGRAGILLVVLLCVGAKAAHAAVRDRDTPEARGEYIFHAAGCQSCHTDEKNKGQLLAGGRALKTPFGTFYGPNITPDPVHGIGAWSDEDFSRAVRQGIAPTGTHYYPALPYTSYSKMSDQDIRDLKAYIFALPPSAAASRPHDLRFPFNMRWAIGLWKFLNFKPAALDPAPSRDDQWHRGRYLAEALAHCAECHTERDFTGGLKTKRWMAGSPDGADGDATPNITPHPDTGMGQWKSDDIVFMLKTGIMPDGDSLGALMADVVEHTTSKLRDDDLAAMVSYLKSLPPVANRPKQK